METLYEGKDSVEFKAYTDSHKCELRAIDGHFRWVCKKEDGTEYIVRPLESCVHERAVREPAELPKGDVSLCEITHTCQDCGAIKKSTYSRNGATSLINSGKYEHNPTKSS